MSKSEDERDRLLKELVRADMILLNKDLPPGERQQWEYAKASTESQLHNAGAIDFI